MPKDFRSYGYKWTAVAISEYGCGTDLCWLAVWAAHMCHTLRHQHTCTNSSDCRVRIRAVVLG